MIKFYCIDCNKEVSRKETKRCHSCENRRRVKLGIYNGRGKNNPNYKEGIFCQKHHCIICNNQISLMSFLYGKKHCRYCANQIRGFDMSDPQTFCIDCGKPKSHKKYKRCFKCEMPFRIKNLLKHKTKSGKLNPNWRGGITKLTNKIRNLKKYKTWIKKVFERDNFTCQICYKRGWEINAHHKIPFGIILSLYSINNIKKALKCKLLWDINNGITLCRKHHEQIEPQLKNSKYRLMKEKNEQ